MVEAASEESLSEERKVKLESSITRNLRTVIDWDADSEAIENQLNLALSKILYRQLADVATLSGKGLRAASFALADATSARLESDESTIAELNRMRSKLTASSLKGDVANWRDYREAAEAAIASSDAANVVQLLEVYETTADEELREYLGARLTMRAAAERKARELDPREGELESTDVERVAAMVRESFEIVAPPTPKTAEQRWAKLETAAGIIIDGRVNPPTENRELLQAIINAVRANTLAGGARAERSRGSMSSTASGKPRLPILPTHCSARRKAPNSPPGERPPLVTQSMRQKLSSAAQQLGRYREVGNHASSLTQLRIVANMYDAIRNLNTDQARAVVTFLLGPKNEAKEQEDVIKVVRDVARYREVRLALADAVENERWNSEQFVALLNHLFKTDFDHEDESWQARAKGALLASVLRDVTPDQKTDAQTLASLGAAYESYAEFYRLQAGLLHVSTAAARDATNTSELLRLLVKKEGGSLATLAASDADKQFAAELNDRLQAADYLAPDDLRRTALLQRMWLHVLAIQLKEQHPDVSNLVHAILGEVDRQDAIENHVLKQIYRGEIALLRMWMLHHQE